MSEPQTLLIVDDEPELRALLAAYFVRRGFRVATAEGFESALAQIRAGNFDLVISDFLMKGRTGIELLRASPTDIPFLLLTGHSDLSREEAQREGAFDMVVKPVSFALLLETVRQALAQRRPQGRLAG